jgi:hypothetical protein
VAPGGIRLVVISAGGIPMAALGPLRDIKLPLPCHVRSAISDVGVRSFLLLCVTGRGESKARAHLRRPAIEKFVEKT